MTEEPYWPPFVTWCLSSDCVLNVILSNTYSGLCHYLQGKTVNVISARRNANMTIQTLRQCRSEESFNSVWQIASAMGLKMKKWLTNSQFELPEARAPMTNAIAPPSSPCRWTRAKTNAADTGTMRPSTRCCPNLSSGLAEMTRKHSLLWEISVTEKPSMSNIHKRIRFAKNPHRSYHWWKITICQRSLTIRSIGTNGKLPRWSVYHL